MKSWVLPASLTLHVAAAPPIVAPAAVVRLASVDAPAAPVPAAESASLRQVTVVSVADGPRVETHVVAPPVEAADDAPLARSRPVLTLAGLLGDARD